MTILSQIVPGLRDARISLTVGLLWSMSLWLLFFLLPDQQWNTATLTPIRDPLAQLPQEALIAFGVLLAYLVGILLDIFRRMLFGLFVLSYSGAVLWLFGTVLSLRQSALGLAAFIVAIAAVYVGIETIRRKPKLAGLSYGTIASETVSQLINSIVSTISEVFHRLMEKLQPDYSDFRELVEEDLELAFGENPSLLPEAVKKINPSVLADAVQAAGMDVKHLHTKATEAERNTLVFATEIALLKVLIRQDSTITRLARSALTEQLRLSASARIGFAIAVYPMDGFIARLRTRMRQADVALRANFRELYDEYDRMRSEGEFRKAVSLPLAVLATISVLTVLRLLDASISVENHIYIAGICSTIWLLMHVAGRQREKSANQYLYACVLDNIVGVNRERLYGDELFVPTEIARVEPISNLRVAAKNAAAAALNRLADRLLANPTRTMRADRRVPVNDQPMIAANSDPSRPERQDPKEHLQAVSELDHAVTKGSAKKANETKTETTA